MTDVYEIISTEVDSREKNIKLWRSVEQTPTSQTKKAKLGQLQITAVKPHFQRQKATEIFGPYGMGWGIVVGSETFNRTQIGDTHLLHYNAVLFYTIEKSKHEFPICASLKEAFITDGGKGYLKIDDCAMKKVSTDALTKGLSFLGFSADVFHGLYDDSTYISKLKDAEDTKEKQDKIGEKQDYQKWRSTVVAEILTCQTKDELETLIFNSIKKASGWNDSEMINKIDDLKTQRLTELKGRK